MGRHAEAESAARALLATLPQAGETVFLLAHAIHQQGRLDEAIPQYELALRYTPMHPSALNNLGTVLRQLGRTEEALVQFRRASEADPGKSWIWSNYASALEGLGHTKEALESLRRAAALAPEETVLQDRLIALANGPETARITSTEPPLPRQCGGSIPRLLISSAWELRSVPMWNAFASPTTHRKH